VKVLLGVASPNCCCAQLRALHWSPVRGTPGPRAWRARCIPDQGAVRSCTRQDPRQTASAPSAGARPFRCQLLRLLQHPQLLGLLTCAPGPGGEEQSLLLTRLRRLRLLTLAPTGPGSLIPAQEAALLQACAAAGGGQEEAGSQQARQQERQHGPVSRGAASCHKLPCLSMAACTDGMGPADGMGCWQPIMIGCMIMGWAQHMTGQNMRHQGRAPHQLRHWRPGRATAVATARPVQAAGHTCGPEPAAAPGPLPGHGPSHGGAGGHRHAAPGLAPHAGGARHARAGGHNTGRRQSGGRGQRRCHTRLLDEAVTPVGSQKQRANAVDEHSNSMAV
jgi:hypothetical protein